MSIHDGYFVCYEVGYDEGVSSAYLVLDRQVESYGAVFSCLAKKYSVFMFEQQF